MQKLLDPKEDPCLCVARHVPAPDATHQHHIVPLSWGGSNDPENTMPLCPTAHDAVHRILRVFAKADGLVRRQRVWNAYHYEIAVLGWQRAQKSGITPHEDL